MNARTGSFWFLVAVLVIGWWQKETIKHWIKPAPQETKTPPPTKTELYSWTDKEGTIHYSDEKDVKHAKKVIVDTAKITPLKPPVIPPQSQAQDKTAGEHLTQPEKPIQTRGLHELAVQMQEAQKKLKEAKEQQTLNQ